MKLFQFIRDYITGKIKVYRFHKAESKRRLQELQEREKKVLKMAYNTREIFLMCNAESKLPSYLKNDIILKNLLQEISPESGAYSTRLNNITDALLSLTIPFIIFKLGNKVEEISLN